MNIFGRHGLRHGLRTRALQRVVSMVFFMLAAQVMLGTGTARADVGWAYFENQTYPSLAAAEAAMRSDPTYGPYFKLAQTSKASSSSGEAIQINQYRVSNRPAIKVNGPAYFLHATVSDSGCSPSESYPESCGNEDQVINEMSSYIRGVYGSNCSYRNERVVGNYAEPFSRVISHYTGNSGNTGTVQTSWGDVPLEKRWEIEVHCPQWTQTNYDYVSYPMYKQFTFRCPEGFYAEDGVSAAFAWPGIDPSAIVQWPYLCSPGSSAKEIRVSVAQVESCSTQHPCHPTTGDKSRREEDFEFAGRLFVRNYHSLKQIQGRALAPGWTHTYQEKLDLYGQPTLSTADGYFESFTSVDSTRWRSNNSPDRVLTYRSDQWYDLTDLSGVTKTFDSLGKLRLITDPSDPANDVTLNYAADNTLLSVVDATGRTLQFEYAYINGDPNPLLSAAVLPDGRRVTYGYDGDDNLTSVDYGNGQIKRYYYHESGLASASLVNHMTGIAQEDGTRYASFGYDTLGRVVSSALQTASGAVDGVQLNYVSDTEVKVTGPLNDTVTLQIAPGLFRRVVSASNGAGTIGNTYDSDNRLATRTDRRGVTTSYGYTGSYLSSITEAVGTPQQRKTLLQRDTANRLVRREVYSLGAGNTDVLEQVASFGLDAAGRRLGACTADPAVSGATAYTCGSQATAPAGVRQVTFAYCSAADASASGTTCPLVGLLKTVDGARPSSDVADTTSFAYYGSDDATCAAAPTTCPHRKGDLWKVTNARAQVTEVLSYNGAGQPLSVKDPNGVVTDYEYSPRNWLTASKVRGTNNAVETDDLVTRIDYWPTGLVKQVTEPDGVFLKFDYDNARRLVKVTDRAGYYTEFTLDNAGHRAQEQIKSPNGATVFKKLSRVYNTLSQLATQADAQSNPTDFTYDANGNPDKITDALGQVTDQDVDPLNRLVRTLQDAGVGKINAETKLQYDALDRTRRVTDPKGLDTVYAYNGLGDLTQLDSPDTGVTNYTYDAAGNRKTQVDARGVTTTYGYDELNRVTTADYSTDTTYNATYTYDSVQEACATDETFSKGRLTQVQNGHGAILQYCYDRFGRMVRKRQTINGKTQVLAYTYTGSGDLQSVRYTDGMVVTYGRISTGRVNTVTVTPAGGTAQTLISAVSNYPSGPQLKWTYGNGRVLNRTHDQNYWPVAMSDPATGGLAMGLGYDAAGRLNSLFEPANPSVEKLHYDYDGLDRVAVTKDGPSGTPLETYGYDATGNRTSFTNSSGTQTYSYSGNSHRLSAVGSATRSYDAMGNTIAANGRGFVYTPAGRLGEVTNITTPISYSYNGVGEQIRRYPTAAPAATTQEYYVYDESGHWMGTYDSTGAMKQQIIWLDDMPVGVIGGSGLKYIEPDHLGTPRAVIDPTRNVAIWTWDAKSEVFGATAPNADPDNDLVNYAFNMRFPGQRYDSATGINYNYFRDYDAAIGRFVQSDPIGLIGGVGTYAYVSDSPTNTVDPLGLDGFGIVGGGAIEGGVGYGAAHQANAGVGFFRSNESIFKGYNLGGYTAKGGFIGGGKKNEFVGGLTAGLGGGFFATNAECAEQLRGPFDTWTLNVPLFSVQFATGGGTRVISVVVGRSRGFDFSRYTVTTEAADTIVGDTNVGCGCK